MNQFSKQIFYYMIKKLFITFLTVVCLAFAANSQGSPTSKLWLGLSSDVTSQPISEWTILPNILYFPIPRVAVGGSGFYLDDGVEKYKGVEFRARVYATDNAFVSGGLSTDFSGTNGYLIEAGYTSGLGTRFYIEPSVRYLTIADITRVSLALGVGIKL